MWWMFLLNFVLFGDVFGSLDPIEAKHNAEEKARTAEGEKPHQLWKQTEDTYNVIDARNASRKGGRYGRPDDHKERKRDRNDPNPKRVNTSCYGPNYQPRFKKPRIPPHKSATPDYKVNPDKWKCYSLSDVDSSQMTERSNTSAALSFLDNLKKQHEQEETNMDEDQGKVVFKNPKALRKNTRCAEASKEVDDKSKREVMATSDGKLVMPEYNFGTKRQKDGRKKFKKGDQAAGLADKVSLGHLDDEDDSIDKSDAGDVDKDGEPFERHIFKSKGHKRKMIRSKVDSEEDSDKTN